MKMKVSMALRLIAVGLVVIGCTSAVGATIWETVRAVTGTAIEGGPAVKMLFYSLCMAVVGAVGMILGNDTYSP